MEIEWTERARKDLRSLPGADAARTVAAVDRWAAGQAADVRKLRGQTDEYRIRVGDWRARVAVDPSSKRARVLRVLPRGSAHKP